MPLGIMAAMQEEIDALLKELPADSKVVDNGQRTYHAGHLWGTSVTSRQPSEPTSLTNRRLPCSPRRERLQVFLLRTLPHDLCRSSQHTGKC
jgi:hypothetical protein